MFVGIVRQCKVKEYEENGRIPYREWIENLRVTDRKAAAVIDSRINRVRTGNLGAHKGVGEGVQELVIDHGQGFRVYFAEDGKELVILLGGGSKRTQPADIEKAKFHWRKYKETKNAKKK